MRIAPGARQASPASSGASGPRRIFVSYRKADGAGTAGRLADALAVELGPANVFRDSTAIRPGMNFVTAIEQALQDCAVLLAVIGPNWLRRLETYGSQPSDGPVDYLRWELKSALVQRVLVIPILIDGATMPLAKNLPEELKPLALLQALELRDKDWDYGLTELVSLIRPALGTPEPVAPPAMPLDWRIASITVLVALGVVAAALLYSGWPSEPLAGSLRALPEVFPWIAGDRHSGDGGIALLIVGGGLALLWALVGHYRDPWGGRVGGWLVQGPVLGVVGTCTIGVSLLVLADRLLTAGALVTLAAAYLAVRGLAPGWLTSIRRAGLASTSGLCLLVGALVADIVMDRARQSNFDVAFLLPPEGGPDAGAGMKVFDDISRALKFALKDAQNVELIPTRLSEDDFRNYEFSNSKALLEKKGHKGYPRVFIRITYTLDAAKGVRRIGVNPYFRPAGRAQSIRLLERWNVLPMAGSTGSPVVALKASFELIAFLSSEGLLRLDPFQRQQVWSNLFEEYVNALAMATGDCAVPDDKIAGLRALRDRVDESNLRRVLFTTCASGTSALANVETSASALATATAPYSDLWKP